MANVKADEKTGRWTVSAAGISPENWMGIIVLVCLGLLIAIRMGFRGINVLGANVSVS